MKTTSKFALVCLIGSTTGVITGCVIDYDSYYAVAECWCGERWEVQIAGANAYDLQLFPAEIPASDTTYTRCVTMLEHTALNLADPLDPTFMALRDAFESEAIAACELAGEALYGDVLDHTDCATTGTDPVATNIVHVGPCWVPNHGADQHEFCPMDDPQFQQQCGEFYDCSDGPIVLWKSSVLVSGSDDGETGGEDDWIPWTGEEELFTCEQPRSTIGSPSTIRN